MRTGYGPAKYEISFPSLKSASRPIFCGFPAEGELLRAQKWRRWGKREQVMGPRIKKFPFWCRNRRVVHISRFSGRTGPLSGTKGPVLERERGQVTVPRIIFSVSFTRIGEPRGFSRSPNRNGALFVVKGRSSNFRKETRTGYGPASSEF